MFVPDTYEWKKPEILVQKIDTVHKNVSKCLKMSTKERVRMATATALEEAAARVASAFARKQSIHAACEATTRFRWEGVDDDVDAAMKTLGGDDDRVVVFHAGSKFEPSAMVKAAEMMTRDDDAVTLGKGREKGEN